MTVGDLLEWLAAGLFIAAAFIYVGLVLALLVGGVCAFYFAQNYDLPFGRGER